MLRLAPDRLRTRLVVLALLAELPAIALVVQDQLRLRHSSTRAVEERAAALAQDIADLQTLRTATTQTALGRLAARLVLASDSSQCRSVLADTEQHSSLTPIVLARADGSIACEVGGGSRDGSAAFQDAFRRAVETKAFVAGELQIQESGDVVFAAAFPLLDEQQRVTAVLYAHRLLVRPSKTLRAAALPEGTTVSLTAADGRAFVYTAHDTWIAGPSDRRRKDTAERGRLDGAATASLGSATGQVIVSVPTAQMSAAANQQLLGDLGKLGAFGLTVLVFVWIAGEMWVVRDVKQLIGATREFAAGNLAARVPQLQTAEVDALAKAFNDMAVKVERRAAERAEEEATRKSLEAQFRQSQRLEAVGQLAGGVAHDFNNLLTVIYACADELLEGPDRAAALEHVREIKGAADRAASLTRQLLAFSRKQVLQPRVLDLNATLAGVEQLLRRLIGEDIELRTTCDSALRPVMVDPNQLEQVVVNLAVNARDAMPGGGRLTLRTRRVHLATAQEHPGFSIPAGEYAEVSVEDTGAGMAPDVQERIFEPFFSTKGHHGTGLGLATVYGIVKQSGGFILVDSARGRGTTFTMYFPVTASPAGAPVSQDVQPVATAEDQRILVVEDEHTVRSLVVAGLRRSGYRVVEAARPLDALQLARSLDRLDVLLTDLVLPDMNGSVLAERVVESWPDVRVLFMSGYPDTDMVQRGILSPGASFIQKPFTQRELASRVHAVLHDVARPARRCADSSEAAGLLVAQWVASPVRGHG